MTLTKEEKKLIKKALDIGYQIISEDLKSLSTDIKKEVLFDDWIEYHNGGSNQLYDEIKNRLENDN